MPKYLVLMIAIFGKINNWWMESTLWLNKDPAFWVNDGISSYCFFCTSITFLLNSLEVLMDVIRSIPEGNVELSVVCSGLGIFGIFNVFFINMLLCSFLRWARFNNIWAHWYRGRSSGNNVLSLGLSCKIFRLERRLDKFWLQFLNKVLVY